MARLEPVNKSYWLQHLSESNFAKLHQLFPELSSIDGDITAWADGKPALLVKLLERAPYTLTLEITHCFLETAQPAFEPGVRVKVYLDSQQAEAMSDDGNPPVLEVFRRGAPIVEVLDYKWSLNFFLNKWLDHCLRGNYRPDWNFDPLCEPCATAE